MDFMGLSMKATQIMMVQTLMLEPVIQNIKRVINICLDGDFANSHAFYIYEKRILSLHFQ